MFEAEYMGAEENPQNRITESSQFAVGTVDDQHPVSSV